MLANGLNSINTGLDEVEKKFRAKYDPEWTGDDDTALYQLLLSSEVFAIKSEEDDVLASRNINNSDEEKIPSSYVSDLHYEPHYGEGDDEDDLTSGE